MGSNFQPLGIDFRTTMTDYTFRSDDNPAKRMRLGTRSCAECRRRKVRCVFPPSSTICEACALHETPCRSQQENRRQRKHIEGGGDPNLQRRVEELEELVRRMIGSTDIETGHLPLPASRATIDVLEFLRQGPSVSQSHSLQGNRSASGSVYTPSTSDNTSMLQEDSEDETENFDDAPLINLFKDAMMIQKKEPRPSKALQELSASHRLQDTLKTLSALIPHATDLRSILEATVKYWSVWPPCYLGPTSSDLVEAGRSKSPLNLVSHALVSGKPAIIAKAVVFLALCIQQLPKDLQRQRIHMTGSSRALIHSYMKITNELLSISTGIGETIDDLECLMLQWKLYLNLGTPRKAWLSARHAINSGLLLGLHRLENSEDKRIERLWTLIWQVDVQMSLLIGLPNTIPASHPSIFNDKPGLSGMERLYHRMCLIAASIIHRDQHHRQTDYFSTVKIQEDLENIRTIMSEAWWNPIASPSASFNELYNAYTVKIQYFLLCRLVHQQYMLQSGTSSKFSHNRISALEASRDLIHNYQGLRHSAQAKLTLCEIMDFEAFCAGIVIVIDLLTHGQRQRPSGEISKSQDWSLVEGLTLTLRHVSVVMECSVAAQGAQVLEFLAAAYRGTYEGPDTYEVVIPYFGKVKINGSALRGSAANFSVPTLESTDMLARASSPGSVEFSANMFSHTFPTDANFEAELGCDWSIMPDMDATYDWFQTFDYNGTSC